MVVLRIIEKGSNDAGKALIAMRGLPGRKGLKVTIGEGLVDTWQQHLYRRDAQEPNRLGGRRTHYWRDAGDSVTSRNTQKGVIVTATQIGIRKKATGGVITPQRAKALTIPVHPDAHGKRAREFKNLFILGKKDDRSRDKGALAREVGGGVQVLYLLRRKATIKADPNIFPPRRDLDKAADTAALEYLRNLPGNV